MSTIFETWVDNTVSLFWAQHHIDDLGHHELQLGKTIPNICQYITIHAGIETKELVPLHNAELAF